MSVVGGAAGGEGEGAAGCNDKNKNSTIECGEKNCFFKEGFSVYLYEVFVGSGPENWSVR